MALVTSAGAGPPVTGSYLKPPSVGGLWGHDDAVGQAFAGEALGAVGGAVVGQDGLGHDRGRGEVVTGVDAHGHAVGDEHFDGGLPSRLGQGVGVAADVQRAGDAGLLAVFGDGLRDGHDVGLVE